MAVIVIPFESVITESDVNFYDYDGALVAAYTISEAQALSALPDSPDHSADGLTFQEWNYTLSQVNATTTKLDIGATYITTDGKTHLYLTFTTVSGKAPTLYFNKSDSSTLSVDWGDGNTSTFTNSGNFNTETHTYSAYGSYVVKIWISSGTGTYKLGQGGLSTGLIYGYSNCITKLFIGENINTINAYALFACYALLNVTIPNNITTINGNVFQACYGLMGVVIPDGITSVTALFLAAYSLQFVSFPLGVTTLNGSMFTDCASLNALVIPSGVTTIGSSAFSGSMIQSLVIPGGVTAIGTSLCSNCFSLGELTITSGVQSIGSGAFSTNRCLKSVDIPSTVTSIGATAFQNNTACTEYILRPTAPPTLANVSAFSGIISVCKIKVPAASLSAYQAAANWSTYANYMEGY